MELMQNLSKVNKKKEQYQGRRRSEQNAPYRDIQFSIAWTPESITCSRLLTKQR
jgi:hypothetical protein